MYTIVYIIYADALQDKTKLPSLMTSPRGSTSHSLYKVDIFTVAIQSRILHLPGTSASIGESIQDSPVSASVGESNQDSPSISASGMYLFAIVMLCTD